MFAFDSADADGKKEKSRRNPENGNWMSLMFPSLITQLYSARFSSASP
jgi:hypothetical protein